MIELLKLSNEAKIKHVPQNKNIRVDILAKLASTKTAWNHRSVIQGTLSQPSVALDVATTLEVNVGNISLSWITPIVRYIEFTEEPKGLKEAIQERRRASTYSVVQRKLYHGGFDVVA